MSLILTNASRKSLLSSIVTAIADAADGALVGTAIMLYQDGPTLDENMVYSNFTECDFTGYARSSTVTWNTAYYSSLDYPELTGNRNDFVMTDTVATNTVKGFALVTGTAGSTVVHAAQDFDTPINLSTAGQGLSVVPVVNLNANGLGDALVLS